VNETFKTISDGYSYQLDVVQEVHGHHSDNTTHFVRADIFILASSLLTRDSFENIAVDLFFGSTFDEEGNTFWYYNVLTENLYNNLSFTSLSKRVTVLFDTTYSKSFTIDPLKSIILSSTLTCSFLTFQQTNFTVKWNISNIRESVNVTLDVGGTKLAISNMSDINSMVLSGNSELNICTDILDKYVNKTRSSGTNRPMDGVLYVCAYVLTYICLSASELCLFITLITYLVFAELRTVPGRNSNVCSHVIKVMTISLCVSVSVVALVIVSSHLTSHTIGYGKKTCYLDSAFLI
ncbi:adhesion G protein-coupled receptor E3, partial [Biomphalaria glabrata]